MGIIDVNDILNYCKLIIEKFDGVEEVSYIEIHEQEIQYNRIFTIPHRVWVVFLFSVDWRIEVVVTL